MKATRRKLAIGRDRMYALSDEVGYITDNMQEIIKIAERFYSRLYASDAGVGDSAQPTSVASDVARVMKEEVEKALKGMKRGRAAGDHGITIELLKVGRDIMLKKLAEIF